MHTEEAGRAFGEWTELALKGHNLDLPSSLRDRIQSDIPDGSDWAVGADARTFWALGPDQVLRRLAFDERGDVTCTSRPLAGCEITVHHATGLVERYRDAETRQRHDWEFWVDGSPLVAMRGIVYGEAGRRPRDRPDRLQRLALALAELA